MKFDKYTYLSPPRAERAVMSSTLGFYEKRGWVAQVKKNGTCSVIFVPPAGELIAKTRHAADPEHKVWAFTPASSAAFRQVQTKATGWCVFVAELMHSKGHGLRDTNYVHDVLVYNGEYLIGKTYAERHDLLCQIFQTNSKRGTQSHWVVNDNTWVAKNHKIGFKSLFARLEDEDEGLVLKNPNGVLSARDNSGWSVKCRRPHKNFGF